MPASPDKQPRGSGASERGRDNYRISGDSYLGSNLKCLLCGEHHPMKSNLGIAEELHRAWAYLEPKAGPSCPSEACVHHGQAVGSGPKLYLSKGRTRAGSKRYQCTACGKTFSVGAATDRQRKPHLNKTVFTLLTCKVPIRRIGKATGLSPSSVYGKLDFIHRQCLAFAAERERALPGMAIPRLYVCVDRQDHVLNWTNHLDRRNIVLHAVGSADTHSRYVFGLHVNFDPSLDAGDVNRQAAECGDLEVLKPFRRFARLWLWPDYAEAVSQRKALPKGFDDTILGRVKAAYDEAMARQDIEAFEQLTRDMQLPTQGLQVHAEYTLYGHFFFLRRLLAGVDKLRFFLDQDAGMRAACLAAFRHEIADRRCDAFYVRTAREKTVDEKRALVAKAKRRFKAMREANPGLTERQVQRLMVRQQFPAMREIGKWRDRWLVHPLPDMSEPEKAVCYLTDYGDYDEEHLANLYLMANLHAIDRVFMQIRRSFSLLERPITTASKTGRTWYGYSPYKPENIAKLLDIFRVVYNYCETGKDGLTPAQRLGLARGPVDLEKIIYF